MLAIFCARLALGLTFIIPWIWHCLPRPRFVRTQCLIALGLFTTAIVSGWSDADDWTRWCLIAGAGLSLSGAIAWTFEPAPFGRPFIVGMGIAAMSALVGLERLLPHWHSDPAMATRMSAASLSSSLLLGSALTAMLVGHSYLIAPGLSIVPLMRSLAALFLALGLRIVLAAIELILWIRNADGHTLTMEAMLGVPVRWLVGLVAPAVFAYMAFRAAQIRSTQSATGILYVAVVVAVSGELLSLILSRQTGLPL
jgi:hypothetical protein